MEGESLALDEKSQGHFALCPIASDVRSWSKCVWACNLHLVCLPFMIIIIIITNIIRILVALS